MTVFQAEAVASGVVCECQHGAPDLNDQGQQSDQGWEFDREHALLQFGCPPPPVQSVAIELPLDAAVYHPFLGRVAHALEPDWQRAGTRSRYHYLE